MEKWFFAAHKTVCAHHRGHLSLQANNPQLLYHPCFPQDASSPPWGTQNNRISPFLPEEAGLPQHSFVRTPQEPGKGTGPGLLQFFPSQVRLASLCMFTLLTPVSLWVLLSIALKIAASARVPIAVKRYPDHSNADKGKH